MDGVVGGDLLDGHATTDHHHVDPSLELETVGATLAHRWEPPFRGGAPPQKLTMGAVQESQTTSYTSLNVRIDETLFLPQIEPWLQTLLKPDDRVDPK